MTDGVKTFGITPDTGFNARISALENLSRSLIVRVCNLEDARDKRAFDEHAVKSQAASAQATQHLYAPLRSDTKPLLEMSAFVRNIACLEPGMLSDQACVSALYSLIEQAAELVKKYT